MTDETYFVMEVHSYDTNSYYKKKVSYHIGIKEKNKDTCIDGISFSNKKQCENLCKYLNNHLEEKVNEKLNELFKNGRIMLPDEPFYFMSAWNAKNEKAIVKRFERWVLHCPTLVIKCHFESDLLVISNAPSDLTPSMICQILDISYDSILGASTFCSEDHILNVSKVRENNG